MVPLSIDHLISETAQVFVEAGYTKRSVEERLSIWGAIGRLHKKNGLDQYDQSTVDLFIADATQKYESQRIGRTRYLHLLKTTHYLSAFYASGEIADLGQREVPTGLLPVFEDALRCINSFPEWGEKMKRSVRQFALPYMKWLQFSGHKSFEKITDEVIRAYFFDCSKRMTVNSIDTVRRLLKRFHVFLYQMGLTQSSFEHVFMFSTPPQHNIQRPISHEDISTILEVVDRTSCKGKRDYAIIILAVVLGLRAVDIAGLRLENIDWISGEIKLLQSKTGKALALPLTHDVGDAVQDYILNGRPQSEDQHIFLTVRSPFTKLTPSSANQIFKGYKRRAGVTCGAFHGLRRSLGSNMVIGGVPVTTVAQVLGHSSIEPTKQYISLDSSNLKTVALSLNELPRYEGERL